MSTQVADPPQAGPASPSVSSVSSPSVSSVSAALAALAAGVDGLLAADLTVPGTVEILDLLRGIEVQGRRLHSAFLAVTGQVTDRGLAAPAGASSTAGLLRQVLPLGAGDAYQRVRVAAATNAGTGLTGAVIPPVLPLLAAALRVGSVGAAQAGIIVATVTGFPADVPDDVRESVEQFLVEQAAVLDPRTLHTVARRIALMADPDGPYQERDAAEKQQFHIGRRRDDGLTRCWGLLDDLTVEALRAALGALCSPAADRNHPGNADSPPDSTPPAGPTPPHAPTTTTDDADPQTDGDGDAGQPVSDVDQPVSDVDQPETAPEPTPTPEPGPALGPRQPWRSSRPPHEWAPLGTLPGDYPTTNPPPPGNPAPGTPPPGSPPPIPPPPDRRSAATRRAHALGTILTAFLNTGTAPTQHGQKPHLHVTITETDLRNHLGHAQLGYGDTIPIAAARMLACDAAVIPAVLRGPSDIIDIGRAMRTFTAACRTAILLRDIGCVFPGCPTPGQWCDNHHIQHWADGGPSNLNNAALLCRRHHTLIHQGHWKIQLGPDHTPHIIPPPTHDPHQRPQHNTLHRPPTFPWPHTGPSC